MSITAKMADTTHRNINSISSDNSSRVILLAVVTLFVVICMSAGPCEATCKTRIIYKTVHVPVHIIKKVPVIKEVKVPVPVYIKHKQHKEHHHEGHHHDGMHKFGGGGDEGGLGALGGMGEF